MSRDYKDSNLRSILNFGHTFGHVIELKYKISHGQAVIVGMLQELAFAEAQGFTPSFIRKNLEDLLNKLGIKPDTKMKADFRTIIHDKKVTGRTIDFPIVEKEGKANIIRFDLKVLENMLK